MRSIEYNVVPCVQNVFIVSVLCCEAQFFQFYDRKRANVCNENLTLQFSFVCYARGILYA